MKNKLPTSEEIAKGFRENDEAIYAMCYQWLMGHIAHFVGHLTSTPQHYVYKTLERFKTKCKNEPHFAPDNFKSFICQISKFEVMTDNQKYQREISINKTKKQIDGLSDEIIEDGGASEKLELIINDLVKNINPACKEIIERYYYKKESQQVIQQQMQFSTSNAVSKKMVRCRNKLKQMLVKDDRLKVLALDSAYIRNLLNDLKKKF